VPVASSLSENLGRLRKARDLSQEELAEAASVGVDTIGRIERGTRRTTRPATLHRLAQALGVRPDVLLGAVAPTQGPDGLVAAELRRAITISDNIPGLGGFAEDAEIVLLPELTRTSRRAWRAYVDGRHSELLHALPALLVDAMRFIHASRVEDEAAGYRILSTAYRLGAGLAGRFGLDDLAWTSAERALQAARRSDSLDIESAISLRYLGWTLVQPSSGRDAWRMPSELPSPQQSRSTLVCSTATR